MKCILLPVLLFLSFFSSILGLPLDKEIQFQHIKEKDGLSSDRVSAILQDFRGFMWFGTNEGLNRYDGYNFKLFINSPYDSTSISHNYITSLFEDRDGILWIGTISGLNEYVPEQESFIRYHHDSTDVNSLSYNTVTVINEDRDGFLWIGTFKGGLNRFDKKSNKITRYLHNPENPQSLNNNSILSIYQDNSGKLWIGTESGLNSLDIKSGIFTHYYPAKYYPNIPGYNLVHSIHEGKDGSLWLGTRGGLARLDKYRKNFTFYDKNFNESASQRIPQVVFKLYGDHKEKLWLATRTCGLTEFDPATGRFNTHRHSDAIPSSISANRTVTAYLDRQGTHWVGLRDDGVSSYNSLRNKFKKLNLKKVAPANYTTYIKSVFIDQDDILWIGASFGLLRFDTRTEQYHVELKSSLRTKNKRMRPRHSKAETASSRLSTDNIIDIYQDKDSILWMATNGGGLLRYDARKFKLSSFKHNINNPNSLESNNLDCLIKDSFGKIWIQTFLGNLNILDLSTSNIERHTEKTRARMGLSNEYISMFLEDSNRILWIATHGDGLYRFDRMKNRFSAFKHNPRDSSSISDNVVTTIYESRSSQFWVGTANGLNRFDRKSNRFFSSNYTRGLASPHIKGILEDDSSNLWVYSYSSLSKIDMNRQQITNFYADDGIEIKFAEDNVCTRDSRGYMYFAGKNGIIYFHPDSIPLNDHMPPMVITDLQIMNYSTHFDSSIVAKKSITLPYNHNYFTLQFAVLDYILPANNTYAYLLEGLEKEWIYSNSNTAHYTNLDPGSYTFRVKGCNNDGLWNETGTSLSIIIKPPWWETWWAYTIYVLLSGLLIYGLFRFELNRRDMKHRAIVAELQAKTAEAQKEAEKEQMRGRIASDLHDEIGSNLSSIAIIGEVLEKKLDIPETERKRLLQIPQMARNTAESMRDIVWFINPSNDSFDKLLAKMRETANLMLEGKEVDFSETVNGSESNSDLNFRRNLFLVYKEILQNIVRHSRATKVTIYFNLDNGKFSLGIKDNGVGFDTNMEFTGNGLKNYQRRAAEMNTNIVVESDPGIGTQVKISSRIP